MTLSSHAAVRTVLARLVARAKSDPEVLAVLLFGSRARSDPSPESDFDVYLVLGSEPGSDLAPEGFRHIYRQYLDQVARD